MLVTFTSNSSVEAPGFVANWTSILTSGPIINSIGTASGPTSGGTNITLSGSYFTNGQYQNVSPIGNTGYDGTRGMVVDASGQYITGEFTGTITLGSTTLTSSAGR
jgi:hypothetical protein